MTGTNQNDEAVASARSLAEMVEYQEGSVVSREIVKSAGGSVTLFAFDSGQGLSEHATLFQALVQVLDGRVEVSVDGQARQVETGQGLVMPANHTHKVKALGRFKMMLVMVK